MSAVLKRAHRAATETRPIGVLHDQVEGDTAAAVVEFGAAAAEAPRLECDHLPPRHRPNVERRSREYLTPDEVEKLIAAARKEGRHGHRDATLVTLAYRHGFRISELVALRWDQVDLAAGTLYVNRLKNGRPSVHPLRGPELRALRRLQREYPKSPYLFVSERGGPVTASTVRKMIYRAGRVAALPLAVHPHMLRHACGFKLANDGHDTRAIQQYLGHKNICHTVRYTELSPQRFNAFFKD